MSNLNDTLAQTWLNIQTSLFPWLSEELGELTNKNWNDICLMYNAYQ